MGDGSRTRYWWAYPLAVIVVAAPAPRIALGSEDADGLFDGSRPMRVERPSHPASERIAMSGAEAAADDDDLQPMRVRRPARPAPEAKPVPPAAAAAIAADPEPLPPPVAEQPAVAQPVALPAAPVRKAEPEAAPARSAAVDREPTPAAAEPTPAPEPKLGPGPQFVTNGTPGDRGMNGTMAVIQDAPRGSSRRRPSADAWGSRLISNYDDQIDVPAGQSVLVRLNSAAERVAIADPEVADVVLVSPREILINGRGRRHQAPSGETVIEEAQTSLVVWDKQGRSDLRELYVNRSRMEQIELRVTMAELNRTALENQGYDFRFFQNKFYFTSQLAKLATASNLNLNFTSPIQGGPVTSSGALGVQNDRVTFSVVDFNDNFAAFIEMLQREGMAKILARPTVLTRSGEEAHFKSGGEVPIPLVTNNQSAVQFKEFGAIVTFTPTFQSDGSIDLRVSTELSEPDSTVSGAVVGGFVVPGFRSRNAQTRVRLHDMQSLMIAGLLRDEESEDERKVPYIGDIPYLGTVFRNTNFIHKKTELVVLVQPRVVSAHRDDGDVPLPSGRGPFTRGEVRTKATPNGVTRPRVNGPSEYHGPERAGDLPEPGSYMHDGF